MFSWLRRRRHRTAISHFDTLTTHERQLFSRRGVTAGYDQAASTLRVSIPEVRQVDLNRFAVTFPYPDDAEKDLGLRDQIFEGEDAASRADAFVDQVIAEMVRFTLRIPYASGRQRSGARPPESTRAAAKLGAARQLRLVE